MNSVATFEFTAQVMEETDKAYKVSDGDITDWIPKSLVIEMNPAAEKGYFVFEIPEWIAEKKGFA